MLDQNETEIIATIQCGSRSVQQQADVTLL